jgi:hypothetical protein
MTSAERLTRARTVAFSGVTFRRVIELTRVIGMSEMRRLLTLADTIELQRAAFASQARGQTTAAPNAWRHPGLTMRHVIVMRGVAAWS